MLPVKTILCPVDFSEPSLAALDAAVELAQRFGAELRVLHVLSLAPAFPTDMLVVAASDLYVSDRERSDDALRRLNELINQRVPPEVEAQGVVKMGYAAHEIVCAANDEGAGMIVMGTHGTSGWRHLAFGSVAEKVVRSAHCPVLTLRGNGNQLARHFEAATNAAAR